MKDHLRFANAAPDLQLEALKDIIGAAPLLIDVLGCLRSMALLDSWLVSGAIYNTVWNVLTGRPPLTGIKDVDIFYWDDTDLSYEAEDAVIKRGEAAFAGLRLPVQIRNQARVHLWYEAHFGQPYAPLASSRQAVDRFASTTHAVAARLDAKDEIEIYAPYGLNDLFSFRIAPNRSMDNSRTHTEKGARARSVWPEVTVVPW
jgi:uncharacterized protein